MNDDQPTIIENVETNHIEDSSTSETSPVETTQEASAGSTAEGTQETDATEAPKKGAESRIRELNARARSAEEKAKSLEAQLAELTSPVGDTGKTPDYTPQDIVKPGEEVDANEWGKRILSQAAAIAELKSRQSEAVNRINNEATQVIQLYPELDPDSDSFNKELSDSITEATLAHVKANPYNASPKKFVEKLMRPYKQAVENEVGKANENLAKQVSQAALRPTSVTTAGKKSYSEKTIAELEAELGVEY